MKISIVTVTNISVTICFWAAAAHCYTLFIHPVNPDTWYTHIACGGDVDNSSRLWTWNTCKTNPISCVEPDLSWSAPQPIGASTCATGCPLDLSISIEEDHKRVDPIGCHHTLERVGLNVCTCTWDKKCLIAHKYILIVVKNIWRASGSHQSDYIFKIAASFIPS